MTYLHICVVG